MDSLSNSNLTNVLQTNPSSGQGKPFETWPIVLLIPFIFGVFGIASVWFRYRNLTKEIVKEMKQKKIVAKSQSSNTT